MASSDDERLAFFVSLLIPRGYYWTLCFDTPAFDRRFANPGEQILWSSTAAEARGLHAGLGPDIKLVDEDPADIYRCDLVGLQTSVSRGEQTQTHGELLTTIDLLDDMLLTALAHTSSPIMSEICPRCRAVLDEVARGLFCAQAWVEILERGGGRQVIEHALHDALGVMLAASSFGSLPPVEEWEALSAAARSGDASAVRQLGRSAMAD